MSRNHKVLDTFDIVLSPIQSHKNEAVRPVGLNPGCQDIPYEELDFLRHIFGRIAISNGFEVEVLRRVNAWCPNCGFFIGYIKLPFIEIPFKRSPSDDVTMRSETLDCDKCHYVTIVAIEEEIYKM